MVLPMIGEGEAEYKGEILSGKEAMKKDDLLKKQGFLVNDDFESLFPPLDGKGKVVCKNQMTKDDKDDIDIDSMMIGFWNTTFGHHVQCGEYMIEGKVKEKL